MSNDGPARFYKTRLFLISQLNFIFKLVLKGISDQIPNVAILKTELHFLKMSGNEESYKAM